MYLSWDEKLVTDFSEANIAGMYKRGYVFTRKGKGVMQQTRSLRVDLVRFELSSENRRVLKHVEGIEITAESLPVENYDWKIGKLAKDFYQKFGQNTFTANKIKELLTDTNKSNFNALLSYSPSGSTAGKTTTGYAVCYAGKGFKDMGLGMMTLAIMLCQEQGDRYIYLGSASRPTDTYKLQFSSLEWFNGEIWKQDYGELKQILKNA